MDTCRTQRDFEQAVREEDIDEVRELLSKHYVHEQGVRTLAQRRTLNQQPVGNLTTNESALRLARGSALATVTIPRRIRQFVGTSGIDVNRISRDMTPLMWTARNGYLEMVQLLLEYGAQVNVFVNHFVQPRPYDQNGPPIPYPAPLSLTRCSAVEVPN